GTPVGTELRGTITPTRIAVFSPDGKFVLAGAQGSQLWETVGGRPIGNPLQHRQEVFCVAYSPDGNYVLTGCVDGTAQVWDAHSSKPVGAPLRHGKRVNCVAFSPDGRYVLTGGDDNTARQWETATGPMNLSAVFHSFGLACLSRL